MQRPVFVVVADDRARLEALRCDLSRRYKGDYRVIGVASAEAALTVLAELARSSAEVALLIADEHLTDVRGRLPGPRAWPASPCQARLAG
jgi:hypothetical protein